MAVEFRSGALKQQTTLGAAVETPSPLFLEYNYMIKRFRYRAYPTREQEKNFQRIFGATRFVYNWGLALKKEDYLEQKRNGVEKPKSLTGYDLSKRLTELKKHPDFVWLNEVPAACLIWSLNHLDLAFKNFFRRLKSGGGELGFPVFKKRGKQKAFSFHQWYEVNLSQQWVTIPKNGKLKIVVHRPFNGQYKTCTVIQEPSGKYYVSLVVDDSQPQKEPMPIDESSIVGIDVGVINALSLSDGHRIKMNLDFIRDEKRILRLQRKQSRKVHGKGVKPSNNFIKAKLAVAKKHERIRLKRKHEIERISCELVAYLKQQGYCGVVMRKYDIKSMVDTDNVERDSSGKAKPGKRYVQRKVNKKILGGAMGMICAHLKYKLTDNRLNVFEFSASETKTTLRCSSCHDTIEKDDSQVQQILKTRIYDCKKCGHSEDIDFGAAKNVLWCFMESREAVV